MVGPLPSSARVIREQLDPAAPGIVISRVPLFVRALLSVLALPGIVAYVVPLGLARDGAAPRALGLVVVGAGTLLLAMCVHAFFTQGRGTLAPWDPPTRLVTSGPYRWSRNPMYIAVLTIVLGWASTFASTTIAWYALFLLVAFSIRIRVSEEPWAAATFGEAWGEYRRNTGRWISWPSSSPD